MIGRHRGEKEWLKTLTRCVGMSSSRISSKLPEMARFSSGPASCSVLRPGGKTEKSMVTAKQSKVFPSSCCGVEQQLIIILFHSQVFFLHWCNFFLTVRLFQTINDPVYVAARNTKWSRETCAYGFSIAIPSLFLTSVCLWSWGVWCLLIIVQ